MEGARGLTDKSRVSRSGVEQRLLTSAHISWVYIKEAAEDAPLEDSCPHHEEAHVAAVTASDMGRPPPLLVQPFSSDRPGGARAAVPAWMQVQATVKMSKQGSVEPDRAPPTDRDGTSQLRSTLSLFTPACVTQSTLVT